MRIIGIDPGIERTGFAVLEMSGKNMLLLDCGCIKTSSKLPFPTRLNILANDLKSVLKEWKPAAAGLEHIYFSKNVKTAMKVSHARGVIAEVLEEYGIHITEFNPAHIKLAVAGDAKADKLQIRKMLQCTLGIDIEQDDTADAIACAICLLTTRT